MICIMRLTCKSKVFLSHPVTSEGSLGAIVIAAFKKAHNIR